MTWIRECPTTPGFYWARGQGEAEPTVVHFYFEEDGEPAVLLFGEEEVTYLVRPSGWDDSQWTAWHRGRAQIWANTDWSGPLQAPGVLA